MWQNILPFSTFVTSLIFSQISKLTFDYCWCSDMFYYPTFLIHQNICTELRYCWVLFKIIHFVQIHSKMVEGGETNFILFCNLNETLIYISKYRMEACPKMSYDLVFQSKQGPLFSYHFLTILKRWQKKAFVSSKFNVHSGLKPKLTFLSL